MAAPVVNQATRESITVRVKLSLDVSPIRSPCVVINCARTNVDPEAITVNGTEIWINDFGAIVISFMFSTWTREFIGISERLTIVEV